MRQACLMCEAGVSDVRVQACLMCEFKATVSHFQHKFFGLQPTQVKGEGMSVVYVCCAISNKALCLTPSSTGTSDCSQRG